MENPILAIFPPFESPITTVIVILGIVAFFTFFQGSFFGGGRRKIIPMPLVIAMAVVVLFMPYLTKTFEPIEPATVPNHENLSFPQDTFVIKEYRNDTIVPMNISYKLDTEDLNTDILKT